MESTGAGHRRAAEAVESALHDLDPTVETCMVNIVDHMNDTLHRVYQRVRNWLMADAPHVFGQLYSWADQADVEESDRSAPLLGLEVASLRSLQKLMARSDCDLAIHTHFFPAEVAAYLRRKDMFTSPHVTVTTDYFSHALWSQVPCERFFVASTEAARYLEHLGVEPSTIQETGIPIDPRFEAARAEPDAFRRESERRAEALHQGDAPKILLSCTGVEPEAAAKDLAGFLTAERPLSVDVLAGGNEDRLAALRAVDPGTRHQVRVHLPRDDMHHLLAQADLAIGKAGGLTCAEAMAVGCPLGIIRPRPDQETQNTEYLLERQGAVRIFRRSLLGPKIDDLFESPSDWLRIRGFAYDLGRPQAASDVAREALSLAAAHSAARRASTAPSP